MFTTTLLLLVLPHLLLLTLYCLEHDNKPQSNSSDKPAK